MQIRAYLIFSKTDLILTSHKVKRNKVLALRFKNKRNLMSNSDKRILTDIINEHPDDIETQIKWVSYSFNVPRGHAIAILENFVESD